MVPDTVGLLLSGGGHFLSISWFIPGVCCVTLGNSPMPVNYSFRMPAISLKKKLSMQYKFSCNEVYFLNNFLFHSWLLRMYVCELSPNLFSFWNLWVLTLCLHSRSVQTYIGWHTPCKKHTDYPPTWTQRGFPRSNFSHL